MRLSVRVETNVNTQRVKAMGDGFAREFAEVLGAETARLAKANVKPGSGPGKHPHSDPHRIDSGALMDSIQAVFEDRGFLKSVRVFTDLPYGLYLEVGVHTKSGTFFRYPWLGPAALQAQHNWQSVAQSTARRWFSETGRAYKGRVNVNDPMLATLPITPERA